MLTSQSVVMLDDGKKATATVRDVRNINVKTLRAVWEVQAATNTLRLAPTGVSVSPGGGELVLTYPSLKQLKLTPARGGTNQIALSQPSATATANVVYSATPASATPVAVTYLPSGIVAPPAEATGADAHRTISFRIDKPTSGTVKMTVRGAGDVVSVDESGPPAKAVDPDAKALATYTLQPGTNYVLTLKSLRAGGEVKLEFAPTASGFTKRPIEIKIDAPTKK